MTRTKQEEYDTAMDHLRRQAARSIDDNACLYRDPVGRKCAIGALIPDEEYQEYFNNSTVEVVASLCPSLVAGRAPFYRAMQEELHDSIDDPDEFRFYLEINARKFCDRFELTYTAPPKDL